MANGVPDALLLAVRAEDEGEAEDLRTAVTFACCALGQLAESSAEVAALLRREGLAERCAEAAYAANAAARRG